MADDDNDEEFEPLFDYSRVQPSSKYISLDDEDDDDLKPIVKAKRLKTTNVIEEVSKDKLVVIDDDEEDWLPSPPEISADLLQLEEDSTIKELRQKKRELVSITESESAQDVLQSIEDSHRKKSCHSLNSALEDAAEAPKAACERPKVVVTIQDIDGPKNFRFFMDEKLELLFSMYTKKYNLDAQNLVFSFDGDKVSPSATPKSLGMEDEDIIEVHEKS